MKEIRGYLSRVIEKKGREIRLKRYLWKTNTSRDPIERQKWENKLDAEIEKSDVPHNPPTTENRLTIP